MNPQTPTVAAAHVASGSRRAFVLHFLEMLAVMFVGMGVFSGLTMLALAAAGSSLSDQSGSLRVMLMGINMSVPMVLWMAIRGHGAMRCVEMAASMMVPTAAAALLVLVDVLDVMAGMAIQHVVMIPAMLGVMLWRYDEYAQPHRRHA
jgi:flagellar biosynthetic protein FliP